MPRTPCRPPMNKIFFITVCVLIGNSAVADANDFRCLKSISLKNPVRLQFTFPSDKDGVGYVTYQNGDGRIALRKAKEQELRRAPGGRPSEFETRWEEVSPDGTGGTYILVSQGALLTGFRYIRKKDRKIFRFEEDLDASTENRCEWNTR